MHGLYRIAAVLLTLLPLPLTAAEGGGIGEVYFNEREIEARKRHVEVDDAMAVFRQIFARLPDEVDVYPTENYYYFAFDGNGRRYSGNFRFHPVERDNGILNFAYFDTSDPSWFRHLRLAATDGVALVRDGPLNYRVEFGGKSVLFRLNALAQESPGQPIVAPGEAFVGRGMDESGLVFTLAYSLAEERFLWVLDPEQPVPVPLAQAGGGVAIHIPTGFAFLELPGSGRRLLLGVHEHEVARNSWSDGPFDQLPDNWLPETRFREFAERSDPSLRGVLNARGEFAGGTSRMSVTPYVQYRTLADLMARRARCRAPHYADVQMIDCMRRDVP